MEMLRVLIGHRNCRGAGLPLGFILEARFLLMGILAGTLIWGGLDLDAKKREGKLRYPICSEDRDGRRKCGKQKLILCKDESRPWKAREQERVEVEELRVSTSQ